jgi:hypothetical protein
MNVGQQMDALLGRGMAAEVLAVGAGAVSSVTGRTYDVLIVNQEAKFTTLTDSNGTNMMTAVSAGGIGSFASGQAFSPGMIIAANNGRRIAAVTLNAGSVIGYTMQGVTIVSAV